MISPTATKPNGSAKPRARVADESSDALAPSRPAPSARPTGGVPPSKQFQSFSEASGFLWSVADLLRGDFKQYDYGKVILPFTVLRRLDCVLADTQDEVLAKAEKLEASGVKYAGPVLRRITGTYFYNVSKLDFRRLLDDPNHIAFDPRGVRTRVQRGRAGDLPRALQVLRAWTQLPGTNIGS